MTAFVLSEVKWLDISAPAGYGLGYLCARRSAGRMLWVLRGTDIPGTFFGGLLMQGTGLCGTELRPLR